MSQDDVSAENADEQIIGSEETQNDSVEDNSHSESKKNQSNFKKLAKKAKELRSENERLKAQLASRTDSDDTEDEDDDFNLDSVADEPFSDYKSEIWFLKNKDAESYRDKMEALIEENPARGKLPLSDLFELAKATNRKSVSKTDFDVSSTRGTSGKIDSKTDFSKLSEEEIEKLSPADTKQFLTWYKSQK